MNLTCLHCGCGCILQKGIALAAVRTQVSSGAFLCLQVLILARVTPRAYKHLPVVSKDEELPPVSPDPLASNIYSIGERHLLSWLNHYYNKYRTSVWQNCQRGGVPSSRWVVNFDMDLMDGLVLGAVLGAHMPFVVSLAYFGHLHNHLTWCGVGEGGRGWMCGWDGKEHT